jgi:magnesium transporter
MISVYAHEPGKPLRVATSARGLAEDLANEAVFLWVDLEAATDDERVVLGSVFRFHPLAIEDCIHSSQTPKVEEYDDYLYMVLHGVTPNATPDSFETIELDAFIGRRFLVTHHDGSSRSINEVKARLAKSERPIARGPAHLLHEILDQVVDHYVPVMESLEERIEVIEEEILANGACDLMSRILRLKRTILRFRRIAAQEREILHRLSRGEFDIVSDDARPYYRDVFDHLFRISDLAETYRDLVQGLMEGYMSVASQRLNEVMKRLTIIASILMPCTLIAGIYGMNFYNMPEIKTEWGYFAALGAMVIVAAVQIIIYRRKGWL